MTSELEQQFFRVFGIEEICTHTIINPEKCKHRRITRCCGCDWLDYPDITAEKLLEMICLASTIYPYCINYREDIKQLKDFILNFYIRHKKEINKHKIQQLFKDEE